MKENVTAFHEQGNARGLDVHPDHGIRTLYINSGIILNPFNSDKLRVSPDSYVCKCPFIIKFNLPGRQVETDVFICFIFIKDL